MCIYVLGSVLRVVVSVAISAWRRCSVRLCLQLFVGEFFSWLGCLCFFAYGGVHHILCCVFVFFFLRLVYPVSLDCQFLIVPSVFSNVYKIYGMALVKLNSIPILC